LAKRSKVDRSEMHAARIEIGELRLSGRQARRLMSTCIELLELCCNVSGKIDPAAGWMVAHARARVFESPR
jgi:hypothetical protein